MNAVVQELTVSGRAGVLLGQGAQSDMELLHLVRRGLPVRAYRAFTRHLEIPSALIAPESTMRRRLRDSGGTFSLEESERLVRIARAFALAIETFGDEERARLWFTTPESYLPGEPNISPLQMCATEAGGRLVESRLRQSQYGFF